MSWGRVKVKKELGAFDRWGLQVEVAPAGMMRRFALGSPAQGQGMHFELMKHASTDRLEELLRQPLAG
jgi:hypothetical protein